MSSANLCKGGILLIVDYGFGSSLRKDTIVFRFPEQRQYYNQFTFWQSCFCLVYPGDLIYHGFTWTKPVLYSVYLDGIVCSACLASGKVFFLPSSLEPKFVFSLIYLGKVGIVFCGKMFLIPLATLNRKFSLAEMKTELQGVL